MFDRSLVWSIIFNNSVTSLVNITISFQLQIETICPQQVSLGCKSILTEIMKASPLSNLMLFNLFFAVTILELHCQSTLS